MKNPNKTRGVLLIALGTLVLAAGLSHAQLIAGQKMTDGQLLIGDTDNAPVVGSLTGTGITVSGGAGTLAISVTDAAITTGKIASGAVTTGKLNLAAVIGDILADDAVTSGKINADAVVGGAGGAVLDNSLTSADLGTGSVDSDELANGGVTTTKLGSGAVTTSKLNFDSVVGGAGGSILDGSVSTTDLAEGAVTTTKLGSGAVGTSAFTATANAPTASALAADPAGCTNQFTTDINAAGTASCASVAEAYIAAGAVTTDKLGSGSVTTNKINTDAVVSANILDGTIAAADLASNAVTTGKISSSAVTTSKMYLDLPELQVLCITTGKLLGACTNLDASTGVCNACN
jgi:hypothetical protein